MNFFKLIAQSSLALSKESELELDYFSGSKIKDEELTIFQIPKHRGLFLQVLLFFSLLPPTIYRIDFCYL